LGILDDGDDDGAVDLEFTKAPAAAEPSETARGKKGARRLLLLLLMLPALVLGLLGLLLLQLRCCLLWPWLELLVGGGSEEDLFSYLATRSNKLDARTRPLGPRLTGNDE
jgi:hypothetical protein